MPILNSDSNQISINKTDTFNKIMSSSVENNNNNNNNNHHHHNQQHNHQQPTTGVNPAQLQNYITWINSHLKKRPGVKLVENLQNDITNGVPLIHLIEIISGQVLADVNLNPKTSTDCKENIEKVLKFMVNNSIKMQRTTSKEILEGNVKSIMRLILALAAHFKPSNLQHASAVSSSNLVNTNRQSSSSITNMPTILSASVNPTNMASTTTTKNLTNNNNNNNVTKTFAQSTNNLNCVNTNLTQQQQQHQLNPSSNQQAISNQNLAKPNLNQTRTLDSMTHLVQAACVSIADVRRYNNENFNIKYVKRNNLCLQTPAIPIIQSPKLSSTTLTLQPPTISSSSSSTTTTTTNPSNVTTTLSTQSTNDLKSNYIINPPTFKINNQTYITTQNCSSEPKSPLKTDLKSTVKTNLLDDLSFSNSALLSPTNQLPLASSTILQPNNLNEFNLKSRISDLESLNKNNNNNNSKYDNSLNETSIHCEPLQKQLETNSESSNARTGSTSQDSDTIKNSTNGKNFINSNTITIEDNNHNNNHNNHNHNKENELNHNNYKESTYQLMEDLELIQDVQSVKSILLNLQNLLMKGNFNELMNNENEYKLETNEEIQITNQNENNNEENKQQNWDPNSSNSSNDEFPLSGLAPEEQIAILRSKIQQLEILCSDLRVELNKAKSESMQKVGVQTGLKSRLNEQDNTILQMKNEQLNLNLINEQTAKEKDEYRLKCEELHNQISSLKQEQAIKDEQLEKMKLELSNLHKEKEQAKLLRQQVKNFSETLEAVQEKECVLAGMLANTDRKLGMIDQKILTNTKKDATFLVNKQTNPLPQKQQQQNPLITYEEVNVLREALSQLRLSYKSNHHSICLIDTLEQGINMISDRSNIYCTNQMSSTPMVSTAVSSSSSNSSTSSSLTSSSANSPVQPTQSPSSIPSVNSSSSNIFSNSSSQSNLSSATSQKQLNSQTSLDKQEINTNFNIKRSTDCIYNMQQQMVSNGKLIHSNNINNNNHEIMNKTRVIQTNYIDGPSNQINSVNPIVKNSEPVTLPLINNEGNVKKIISRLLAQSQGTASTQQPFPSNNNNHHPQPNKRIENEDQFSCNPSTIIPTRNVQQSQTRSSTLLTISSSNTTVCSNQSPSLISQPSTSSTCSSSSTTCSSATSISNTNCYATKCVYYIDKDTTPYMTTIFKSVSNITLMDFKERVKLNPGINYRFFFKSQEPEFGFLKEEITNENRILPCFENRIVAWVEESH